MDLGVAPLWRVTFSPRQLVCGGGSERGVPVEAILEQHGQLKWALRGRAAGAVTLLLLAAFVSSEWLAAAGGVAALAWFVALAIFRLMNSVGGRVDKSGDGLQLGGVRPRFAHALDEQPLRAGRRPPLSLQDLGDGVRVL